jgi:hypothetical protein
MRLGCLLTGCSWVTVEVIRATCSYGCCDAAVAEAQVCARCFDEAIWMLDQRNWWEPAVYCQGLGLETFDPVMNGGGAYR